MNLIHCLSHSGMGGGQQAVYTLLRQITALEPSMQITVVLPPEGIYVSKFKELGIRVEVCSLDTLEFRRFKELKTILRKFRSAVVHTHGKGAGLYGRFKRLPGYGYVHSFHGFHPPTGTVAKSAYVALEGRLLRNTDSVVNISRGEHEEVLRAYPTASTKTHVIPNVVDRNGVSADSMKPMSSEMEEFMNRHSGRFIVTMIGRNDPVKNYALAVSALSSAMSAQPNIAAVLIGIDPGDERFTGFASSFPGRVLLIPNVENPSPVLRRSSVLLMTSKKEGLPLVALEAFCLGVPVVGTNVPGIRDVVAHDESGLLCESTPESVSTAIATLAGDKESLAKLSKAAAAAGEKQDVVAWAKRYLDLYSTVRESRP